MRPLKLTMTAFGPYKYREIIDFAALEDRRLFVISGNTGAGKTSIFDAICFALYGTASGEDRQDSRMLRSHFADEDTHTAVELEFSIGQRSYRILRQMGHKKGANKTETGARIELYELINGQEIPCISRFTIPDVNDMLERIIGLTCGQFSQIVMLPQGEFRKLLTSETENKEEILRRIFRTELYQTIEDRFKQRTTEMKTLLQSAQTELNILVKQIPTILPSRECSSLVLTLAQEHHSVLQVLDGLEQEQSYYLRLTDQLRIEKDTAQSEVTAREAYFHEAKAINERFQQYEHKSAEKTRLEEQLPAITNDEIRLRQAEKAAQIEPYEEQWQRFLSSKEHKRLEFARVTLEVEAVLSQWELAEERYIEGMKREEERKLAERELLLLQELAPSVQSLHANQLEVGDLLQNEQAGASQIAVTEAELDVCRKLKTAHSEQIKQLDQEVSGLTAAREQLLRLREQAKLVKNALDFEQQIREIAHLEAARQLMFERKKLEHDRLERLWIEGQSSQLAAHLHDGMPCPVCGSTSHPDKAEAVTTVPTKEELQVVKEILRRHEQEFNESRAQLAATQAGLAGKQAELSDWGLAGVGIESQYERLVQEGLKVKETTSRLEQQVIQLQQLKADLEQLDHKSDKLSGDRDLLTKSHHEIKLLRHSKQSLLEKELERIPEHLRTPDQLDTQLAHQKNLLNKLNLDWKQAQEQVQLTQTKLAEQKASSVQIGRQLEDVEASLLEADSRLQSELAKAGFSQLDEYRGIKMSEQTRVILRAELESFRTNLASLKQQIKETEQELVGKEKADLDELQTGISQRKIELDKMNSELQHSLHRAHDAERLRGSMISANEQMKNHEQKWQSLRDIYAVITGDNPLKISFERYILIEFLEQILSAANERLHNMSNGQFSLQRSDRLEKQGRQSGLGLDVYDAYTGMNRDVKSLSGGEKFNASLCLALGMTDVIQAHQGGISIEMMFIDEGFGSLDEDSLNKAIETLVDLQKSGRMIGVISHVQELKAAFPAILEVTKTKEGHSQTAIVVK